MIANGATDSGIAPGAKLYSSAHAVPRGFAHNEVALSMQQVVTQNGGDVPILNFSSGEVLAAGRILDGNNLLTEFVDWSAKTHDVLYVISGNEDVGRTDVVPTDEYNGMTVSFTRIGAAGQFSEIDPANDFTHRLKRGRSSVDITAPGRDIIMPAPHPAAGPGAPPPVVPSTQYTPWSGTSFAAPHVSGAAALLHEYAVDRIADPNALAWDVDARRHEVIKAVLMNSADKIVDPGDGSALGMTRTITKTGGAANTWLTSKAADSLGNPFGKFIPLDEEMGAGQLNVSRALTQYQGGETDANQWPAWPNVVAPAPAIGWDLATMAGATTNNYYLGRLKGGTYVSLTLAWDRKVEDANNNGVYDANENFSTHFPADLDLYLVRRDTGKVEWASISPVDNVEHMFFQLPARGGEYEIRVVQKDNASTTYGLAWWTVQDVQAMPPLPGGIAGRAWEDADENGIQDIAEVGIESVRVDLFDAAGTWMDSTWTDASGDYSFASVAAGSYYVEFTNPVDTGFTALDVGADSLDSDADFSGRTTLFSVGTTTVQIDAGLVEQPFGTIGDFVWDDLDGDGVQDAGEPGLADAVVYLIDASGHFLDLAYTDEDGHYQFVNVEPGDYRLHFETLNSYKLTTAGVGNDVTDSDAGTDGFTEIFTVGVGQDVTSVDAGMVRTYMVTGLAWDDTDRDGVQDEEEPSFADVSVRLLDVNGNVAASTVTDEYGQYAFDDLPLGTYTVEFVAPTGYRFSPRGQGGDSTYDSDVYRATGRTGTITLTAGEDSYFIDAGLVENTAPIAQADVYAVHQGQLLNVPGAGVMANDSDPEEDPLTAELVSYVSHGYLTFNYRFENGSAVYDPGAFFYTAYAGYTGEDSFSYRLHDGSLYGNTVTVTINVTDQAPLAIADEYEVHQGQMLNVLGAGVLANDSDLDEDVLTAELVSYVSHGYLTFNYRFENGSAVYDPGAFFYTAYAGYAGEDAFTYRAYDGALYSETVTVTIQVTDEAPVAVADGVYEVHQGQMLVVPGTGVLANDSDADDDPLSAELVSYVSHGYLTFNYRFENGSPIYDPGAFFYTAYAGYLGEDSFTYRAYDGALYSEVVTVSLNVLPLATITGSVFGDTDADGTRDEMELGWAGIVVRLLDSEGVEVASTTTDSEGNYTFDLVLPGDYRVAFVPPEGASFTLQDQGDDSFDSDVNAMGVSDLFWIASGQLFDHLDAGIV